jgi:hypothetical protein
MRSIARRTAGRLRGFLLQRPLPSARWHARGRARRAVPQRHHRRCVLHASPRSIAIAPCARAFVALRIHRAARVLAKRHVPPTHAAPRARRTTGASVVRHPVDGPASRRGATRGRRGHRAERGAHRRASEERGRAARARPARPARVHRVTRSASACARPQRELLNASAVTEGKGVLCLGGFSQGAALTIHVAVTRPALISRAIVCSGCVPFSLDSPAFADLLPRPPRRAQVRTAPHYHRGARKPRRGATYHHRSSRRRRPNGKRSPSLGAVLMTVVCTQISLEYAQRTFDDLRAACKGGACRALRPFAQGSGSHTPLLVPQCDCRWRLRRASRTPSGAAVAAAAAFAACCHAACARWAGNWASALCWPWRLRHNSSVDSVVKVVLPFTRNECVCSTTGVVRDASRWGARAAVAWRGPVSARARKGVQAIGFPISTAQRRRRRPARPAPCRLPSPPLPTPWRW